MKRIPFFTIFASLYINFMGFPQEKILGVTAYDIVCEFKYQIGDQSWV